MAEKAAQNTRGWMIFWLILLIGVLPMVAAWYLVNHPGLLGKPGNRGSLIEPPRPVGYDSFRPVTAPPSRPLREIRGRWVIIHVIRRTCARACQETIANTHKLHLLFNKDIPRVRRLVIWPEIHLPETATLEILGKDRGLYFAAVSEAFLHRLEREILGARLHDGQVILMDPLGNLMMWYDSNFDPFGLYHDLRRLLRASRIG